MGRILLLAVAAMVLAGAALAGGARAEPVLARDGRRIMGTYVEVQAFAADAARAQDVVEQALEEVARVDRLLSNYDPSTELSRMNRDAADAPIRVSDELFAFLRECRGFYGGTHGTFDPTVGPLVRAWGFLTPAPAVPDAATIASARARTGFDKVHLDDRRRTVHYAVAGLEIDPGGIGKGIGVDRAVARLRALGIAAALVSAGGSTIAALGHPPDRAVWRVAVANPRDAAHPVAYAALVDASVSTSGQSEKFVRVGQQQYGHIFDPRTGTPKEGMCLASVVAPTATASDALTKAAFLLERAELVQVLRAQRGTSALRVEGACDEGQAPWVSPGVSPFVVGRADAGPRE